MRENLEEVNAIKHSIYYHVTLDLAEAKIKSFFPNMLSKFSTMSLLSVIINAYEHKFPQLFV